jgi:hypothetical protein
VWQAELVPIYEYLVIIYVFETNWAKVRNQPVGDRPEQTWSYSYYIWRPNAKEAERRPMDQIVSLAALFSEFGRDGWKLVTTDIPDSTISSGTETDYWGWVEVGVPVRQRWTFIREVGS